jgi:hypothetical protein
MWTNSGRAAGARRLSAELNLAEGRNLAANSQSQFEIQSSTNIDMC